MTPTPLRAPLLLVLLLSAAPVLAANKDIERLQVQIAALQGQFAELQRGQLELRDELKRVAELVAEQNALLRRGSADAHQQDEAVTVGMRELGERVAELREALDALKAQAIMPMPTTVAPDAAAGAAPGPGAVPVNAAPPPAPRELYSQAYADYARGNYDLAMQGFSEYLTAYPDTDFSDNAQYWIGECLYGKKEYEQAIEAWNQLLKDFGSSDKVPDARVKKGMALERLGRRSQALVEYRFVVDRYPTSQAARIARERLSP